ncbi:hypothetical protein EAG_13271, partial [Camponotus floridanus]
LLVVLAAMALLYTYYYHSCRIKKWFVARSLAQEGLPPIASPKHKRHNHLSNTQLRLYCLYWIIDITLLEKKNNYLSKSMYDICRDNERVFLFM